MADSTLETLVRRHTEQLRSESQKTVDWAERTRWWQIRVTDLIGNIETWLAPLIATGLVKFERSQLSLSEQYLGPYTVESAVVSIQTERLKITPVATIILGGYGRVDISGPQGRVLLVLADADVEPGSSTSRDGAVWYITALRNRRSMERLDQAKFEKVFADLFGIER